MEKHNSTVRRIVEGKHVNWKDGEFFIWNVPGMNLPMYAFIDLIHTLKKEGADVHSALYLTGEKQAVIAVDYMKSKFGMKKETDIINAVVDQILLLGFGITKLMRLDKKGERALFVNKNSPFAKYYRQIKGTSKFPVDGYIAGVLAGTIEGATNKQLVCVERKCIVQGNAECVFEVLSENFAKKEYPDALLPHVLGPEGARKQAEKEKSIVSRPKA